MYYYWPCAMLKKDNGEEEQISTYSSCMTEKEAMKQFDIWLSKYGFILGRCWIELYSGKDYVASKEIT